METTIDQLQIEIQASSSSASSSIDALANSLSKLRAAVRGGVGLTTATKQFRAFSDAVRNIQAPTRQIEDLVSSLRPLETIGKSNLGSTINQLKKLPEITQALEKTDMGAFASKIQEVTAAILPLSTEMNKVALGFSKLPTQIQKAINANAKMTASNRRTAKSFFSLSLLTAKVYALKRVANVIADWINNSNAYVENLNLFTVAMGKYTESAKAYAEQVQELVGIDASEFMRYQGVFMNMAKGFGIAEDKAYKMSKNLTQLGYDLASLYNVKFDVAMEKLESALSGQPRPMREWGFDLSEATLKVKALAMGIEKNVELMSQAEKAQIRYVQLLETAQKIGATGDLARTLNTTANQLRVLKAQVDLLGRSLGNIFIPVLNQILPYAIAFLKVMRNIANTIANFFGFSLPEIDYSGLEEMGTIIDEDTEAAKELKNALLGIDELNILNEKKTGSILGDSIDIDIPEYDFLKEIVQSKSNIIAEKLQKPLEDVLKTVAAIGASILGWKVSSSFISSIASLQKFLSTANSSTLASSLSKIGGQLLTIAGLAATVYGVFEAITKGVGWDNLAFMIGGVAVTVSGLALAFGATAAQVGLVVGGLVLLTVAFIDITKNGLNLQNTLLLIAGTFSTGLGMTLLTNSTIPLLIAAFVLLSAGIVDIVNNGVTLENSLLALSGIMLGTLALAIKNIMAGMVSLGVTIGLVGLAATSLVGSFLYISSVWSQMSGLEKAITLFTGLASAALAAALAIAVFHASWTQGIAVAIIVGSLAALTAAFVAVKNNVDKVASGGAAPGVGNGFASTSGAISGNYTPQYQTSTYGNVATSQNQYQAYAQQSSADSKEIIRLLTVIANKDPNIYMDGQKVSEITYPYYEQIGARRGLGLVR